MSKKVVKFEFEKETKNSVRYKEVPDEAARLSSVLCMYRSGLREIVSYLRDNH